MNKNDKIAVLLGGSSKEREISIRTGRAVAHALKNLHYTNVHEIDPSEVPDFYTQHWDMVFMALHGEGGEDGTYQKVLAERNIPCTGSDAASSFLSLSKLKSKEVFVQNNIPTLAFLGSHREEDALEVKTRVAQTLTFPIIGKPDLEGSSLGMKVVSDPSAFTEAFVHVHSFGENVLWENFQSEGVDLTVAILGDDALPVVEIRPKEGLYDYDAKYTQGRTDYFCPARISDALTKKVQDLALQAFQALGCSGWGRVDFLLVGDDLFCLEINTVPGMTPTSLVPMAAKENGMSFETLVERIMLLACS